MSQPWQPLPYMLRAASFLYGTTAGGLPLEPGARKTSITLCAFSQLLAEGKAKKMLVVAPKRVCHFTWPAEIAKWKEFEHLRYTKIMGDRSKREKGLATDADVYLINPDNIAWLCDYMIGKPWPFDVVTIDELTKFKNPQSQRSKALRPFLRQAKRRWGLTGSLTSNGYLDVFGQQLILDDGAALGRFITRYRDQYFVSDFTGFVWTIRPGAAEKIAAKISPYWFEVDPAEYSQLPEIVDDVRPVLLDSKQRKQYDDLESTYMLTLPDGIVTAANAGAVYSKLAQLANGAVYTENPEFTVLNNVKLDALQELVDELNGAPVLVGYEFQHDLARIQERFGKLLPDGTRLPVPCFGGGFSETQEEAWKDAWNRGELPMLVAHPQSAGHGLNLQENNARHVAWFGLPWSWELFDQFIRRVRRSGNTAERVFNHMFIVPSTIDDLKLTAVRNKFKTHSDFMGLLASYIKGEKPMSEQTQVLPPGWTRPATRSPDTNGTQQGATANAQNVPQQAQNPAPPTQATVGINPAMGGGGGHAYGGGNTHPTITATEVQPQPSQRHRIRDQVASFADAKVAAIAEAGKGESDKVDPRAKLASTAASGIMNVLHMLAEANVALVRIAETLSKR